MPESQPNSSLGLSKQRMDGKPLLPLFVDNLTLMSGDKLLLNNLNLMLTGYGISVILGVNGAGKSLLLRVLHGLITPSAGEVHWGGNKLNKSTRKRQAMVFQKPVLLRRSVSANIEFAIDTCRKSDTSNSSQNSSRGSGGINASSTCELLKLARLETQADQPARLLSGGEQQRLALARAIALSPEVMFLDEPTASLDPSSTMIIEDIVRVISHNGTKIIFVTHDVGQAKRLAEDIVFLQKGCVAEHTQSTPFFKNPTSQAARSYLDGHLVT